MKPDLRLLLRAELDRQGVTFAELGRRLDVSRSTAGEYLDGSHALTVTTADRIARALGKVVTFRLSPRHGVAP